MSHPDTSLSSAVITPVPQPMSKTLAPSGRSLAILYATSSGPLDAVSYRAGSGGTSKKPLAFESGEKIVINLFGHSGPFPYRKIKPFYSSGGDAPDQCHRRKWLCNDSVCANHTAIPQGDARQNTDPIPYKAILTDN